METYQIKKDSLIKACAAIGVVFVLILFFSWIQSINSRAFANSIAIEDLKRRIDLIEKVEDEKVIQAPNGNKLTIKDTVQQIVDLLANPNK